jgi:hypothetical protein
MEFWLNLIVAPGACDLVHHLYVQHERWTWFTICTTRTLENNGLNPCYINP